MIVFDEDAVAQRLAVIRAPAEEDRPFLKRTQARDRLSRVQDGHRVSANRVAEPTRQGGDTGEVLEKVQGDSFSLQDGSPIAFDLEETVSIVCAFSILAVDGVRRGTHPRVERFARPRQDLRPPAIVGRRCVRAPVWEREKARLS